MKKIVFLLGLSAILFSCGKTGNDEFILKGSVAGVDGKNVILERQDDSLGVVAVDTVKIENGKFQFTGTALEPAMYALAIETVPAKSYVVIENGEIDIEINKDSTHLNKMRGTYNNEQLTDFSNKSLKIQKKILAFQVKNQAEMMAAHQKKDTAVVNKIRTEFMVLKDEMDSHNEKYIETHPKAFISLLLIKNMFATPLPDMAKIEKHFNTLDASLKKSTTGKNIAKRLKEASKVDVGTKAPDFSAPNPDGKIISLQQSLGKVTIIDFWASWCGPCRRANPELVALYDEFHSKGLNIIGVSLDKEGKAGEWKDAIAKDKLTWTQVSNLKFWDDPVAKTYNVTSIPQMFILDAQGMIIAKDLRGDALRSKVAELLQ